MAYKFKFPNRLITRNQISFLFSKLSEIDSDEIILDFVRINYISRSCADEYLKMKSMIRKKIIERNISESILSMLDFVRNQVKNEDKPLKVDSIITL